MIIASLNVSMPEAIEYKGSEVLTGINKRATREPRMARRLNIDGDGQADLVLHGGVDKAVYAFPAEHYRFYQQALARGETWAPGQFGENLTTEGMLESEVRIGNRYRIGEALFEVSQPRSPCYKFAIRMEAAEALLLCIDSAKTGFYLRVIEEGMLRAGDEIELDFENSDAQTVEEIHLLYFHDKKNVEALTRAVACESLAGGFKNDFRKRLDKLAAKR